VPVLFPRRGQANWFGGDHGHPTDDGPGGQRDHESDRPADGGESKVLAVPRLQRHVDRHDQRTTVSAAAEACLPTLEHEVSSRKRVTTHAEPPQFVVACCDDI
jgi:hypothetical protein